MGPVLIRYVTLFPLLLQVWQERPLTPEDIVPGPYPPLVTAEQVALQRAALARADRELRLVILRELRETQREDAHRIMLEHLAAEQDRGVLAALLEQLALSPLPPDAIEAEARARMSDPDDEMRTWAAAVCARFGGRARDALVKALAEDPAPAVREQAARGLRDMPGGVDAALYEAFRADPNPRVAAAIAAGFSLGADAAGAAVLARDWGDLHDAARFAVAARLADASAAVPPAVIPLAVRDPHPAVRGEAAAAMARLGRPEDGARVLALVGDPDPEVRRRAVAACRSFPSGETLQALLGRLEDERTLVRREAEDVLVESNPRQPAGPAVAERLGRTRFPGRAHQCRVLARIGFADSAGAVHACLRHETEPEGIRDAVFALGRFGYREAAPEIAALGEHESAVVREAVGEALGFLAVPSTFPVLQKLAFAAEPAVRQAAILAIARTGDGGAFAETIRAALVATAPEKMTPSNRAAAAWAAGRLRPVSPDLVRRLKVQATEAVVPGPMGMPVFEDDFVLVSVDFALAQLAREDALAREVFGEVYAMHQVVVDPRKPTPQGVKYVPSAEVREYSRQAFEYLQGTAPERRERPLAPVSFHVDVLPPE